MNILSKIIIFLISFYQRFLSFDRGILMVFSPGGACKFYPSCSEYTKRMVVEHGVFLGTYKGLRRISKCR